MKSAFLFCSLFAFPFLSWAQSTIDFETVGQDFTWTVFGNVGNEPTLAQVVDNPDATGENTSTKVLQYTIQSGANTWAGLWTDDFGSVTFTDDNKIVTIAVRKGSIANFDLKWENPAASIAVDNNVPNTVTDEWEIITFDCSSLIGSTVTRLVLLPDFQDGDTRTSSGDVFIDTITFGSGETGGGEGGGTQVDLPISFDEEGVDYTVTDFGDASTVLIADPTDASNMVACTTKPVTAPTWAGTTMSTNAGLATALPFSATATQVSVRVYSPDAGIQVRLKAEDKADVTHTVETEATTTVAGAWETLTFDFANQAEGTAALNLGYVFDKVSIFFNFGTDGATAGEKIYYWDDITFTGGTGSGGGGGEALPFETIDFESNSPEFTGFGGNNFAAIANPDASGLNTSATVGSTMHGAETWAGIETLLADSLDFTTKNAMKMKVWSPTAGTFKFKIEAQSDAGINLEVDQTIAADQINQWVELVFDFTGAAVDSYDKMALFFDFDVSSAQTFYFDDIEQLVAEVSSGGSGIDLPLGFDDTEVDYGLEDFGGTFSVLAADPADNSNTVVMTTKSSEAADWGGTTMVASGLGTALPFAATDTQVSVRVYSPDAGIQVRLKAEDVADVTHTVETEATTTVANAWETLTFDFANQAEGTAALNLEYVFNKLSIFFNFGVTGADAGEKVYYWDDVVFSGGTGGGEALPFEAIDFESNSPAFTGFGGNDFSAIANPDASGLNTSATVGSTTHGSETWAGIETLLADSLDFTTENAMKMKVWSPTAGTFKFKIEAQSDAGINLEVDQTIAADQVNQWVELVFDFTGAAVDTYDKMALFFDFGVSSAQTFYFDDVEQVVYEVVTVAATLPVDFEGAVETYPFGDFEGGVGSVIDNPGAAGINTSAKVGQMQKFAGATFAGSTLGLDGEVDFSAGNVFTMKVWASRSVPVTFKLEGLNVERISTHSGSSSWEELSFDFGSAVGAGVNAITLIFDNGVAGDAAGAAGDWTFYFDEINLGEGTGEVLTATLPVTFEDDGGPYAFANFEGGVGSVIANPGSAGMNTSPKVGQMQKFNGATFGGSTLGLDGEVDFSAGNVFTMKVWASRSVPVTFKLEGLNVERVATHSGSGSWENLQFDFTGSTGAGVSAITLIFDNGVAGNAADAAADWTFYFDDIVLSDGSIIPVPIDFENDLSGIDAGEGTTISLIENPNRTGLNLSPNVAALVNPGGVESTMRVDLGGKLNLASQSMVQVRVWSPKAGITVRMSLGEKAAPGSSSPGTVSALGLAAVSRDYVMTKTNEWEIITFDFNGEATNTYDEATLAFDVGSVDANTYYVDSLSLVDVGADNPHLVNVSTRGMVLSGEQILIVGFVIDGSSDKSMLIRGVGPTLSELDVVGALSDPYLEIYDADGNMIMENDDWSTGDVEALNDTMDAAGAFPLVPDSKDAAIVADFAPGIYTAHLYGVGGVTGVGMIEAYETQVDENRLVNISTRGDVGVGENVLIGGFVVSSNSCTVLIRAAGSVLGDYSVEGVLADPVLQIFDSNGVMIAENDDWSTSADAAEIALVASDVGAFDFVESSNDSAILMTLGAGVYTAQVSGADGSTGVALVEVYEVQIDE